VPVESFKLESLIINNSKLRTLDLSWAWNIVMLNVARCEYLVALHMPIESPNLKHLRLQCSKLKTLKLTCALNLEEVDLTRCKDLEQLQMPIEKFNLKSIYIKNCKLRTLNLTWAENLKNLKVEDCEDLEELHMPAKSLELNSIIMNGCSKVRILELGQCPNLRQLELQVNYNLVEIHAPIVCLQECVHINISCCVRFKHILFNRWFPEVGLRELHLSAKSLDTCPLHPDNNMPKLGFEYIYDHLPTSIIWTGNFEKLISFGLCACTNLSSFSKSIYGLQCLRKLTIEGSVQELLNEIHRLEYLENLYLWSTKIEHIPDSICLLKHLKFLRLQSCWLLEQLPEDLGMLECLEELYLMECTFLITRYYKEHM